MLAALALVAAPLAAQGGGMAGRGNPMAMLSVPTVDTLTHQLGLTADQQVKVKALVATYDSSTATDRAEVSKVMAAGNMQALRGNASFGKVREARTKFVAALKEVLTPEQVTKYDALYPSRMGRRPSGN
jgi:Spy/CpxP family protein refolding chaperone